MELRESEQWKLEKGTLYVVERGDSALMAFRVPEGPFHGFLMAAAHSDSPTFKVRETAEAASAGNTLRLSVEPYGGGVWRGWLDRPLSVAGRVVIRQGDRLVSRLVNIDRDLLVIPGVAIHMDRSVNKGAELNPAVDLLPLLGCGKEPGAFRKLIAEAAGVREEHLLSTELFLYPRTKAVQTGLNGEFIVSPRLDDLQCVFGCLEGFLAAKPGGSLPVLAVFNNEEVGSNTRQGADSTFLTDVLERIASRYGPVRVGFTGALTEEELARYGRSRAVQGISAGDAHEFLCQLQADEAFSPVRTAAARAAVWDAFLRQDLDLLPATLPDALRASSSALLTDLTALDYDALERTLEFLANNSAAVAAQALPGQWNAASDTYTVTDASRAAMQTFFNVSPTEAQASSFSEP